MTVHAGFDQTGTTCSGHAQNGTVALAHAVQAKWGGTSDGIYACRPVRGGKQLSEHGEGRAYDHAWSDEATGCVIAQAIVDANAELGVEEVIFWDRIWSYTVGHWHDYTGQDPHHGHIHIGQNWSGARELTYEAAVLALNPRPTQHPDDTEDNPMPRIYTDKTGADPEEILVDGALVVAVASPEDAQAFVSPPVNAETVPVSAAQHAAIKAKAHS